MNSKFYKEQARTALNGNEKVFALCVLIMFFFSVPSLATRLAQVSDPMLAILLYVIEAVLSVCLISILQFSFSKMSLKALHNENIEISQLFDGFKIYGKVICKNLIETVLIFIGMLFFIIPAIILTYSLAMSDFLLADNPELTASEAVEESYEMMKGHRLELFALDLSFAGWLLLEILTLGLLSLWVTPYIRISHAAFYERLKKEMYVEENNNNYGEQFTQPSHDYNAYQQFQPVQSLNDPVGFEPVQQEVLSPENINEE